MFYLLLTSIILLVLFALLKLWELKSSKTSRLSRMLASQDERLRNFGILIFKKWLDLKRRTKLFIFSQLPAHCFLMLERAVAKLSDYYNRLRYYVRGKLQIRKDKVSTSHFLKEIAKVKEENRENGKADINS